MADHTSITDTTSQPIQETPAPSVAETPPDQSPETPPEASPEEPVRPNRQNRLNREQRRAVNLRHIRETILESFVAHDSRMRALSHKPPRARRICQIILHGPHSDGAAMVARDEPYTLIVTSNRIPVKAEEWRAGVMATLSERLGMPVHITLMKEQRFLAHCKAVSPFYEALSIAHETLYPHDGTVGEPPQDPDPIQVNGQDPQDSVEAPDPAPKEPKNQDRNWWDAPELWTYKAMHKRAAGTLSRDEAHMEMEEPLARLMGNTVLLRDLASGGLRGDDPQAVGLYSLAFTMRQQADTLYRLFHGRRSETYR